MVRHKAAGFGIYTPLGLQYRLQTKMVRYTSLEECGWKARLHPGRYRITAESHDEVNKPLEGGA